MMFDKDLAKRFGNWRVGHNQFNSKMEAAFHASRTKENISFEFNDTVWKNFDRSLLGKISLKELYRQRAQQIRDSYDYVVLYYSGGSDSTNILETFIENNIKLDCVFVKWNFDVVNSSLHNPNIKDKSAYNFNSEWDYATKPRLEWLAKNHPEIRIETKNVDGMTNEKLMNDAAFEGTNNKYSAVNLLRKNTFSDFEKECIEKGKSVAQVSGIDKPLLVQDVNGDVNIRFVDDVLTTLNPLPNNLFGVEFFYWSTDFPLLTLEMAYQMFLYYDLHPAQRFLVPGKVYAALPKEIRHACIEGYFVDVKKVCYPNWDLSIFQTEKPKHRLNHDKDAWFYQSPAFDKIKEVWQYYHDSRFEMIDQRFCEIDPLGKKLGLASNTSQSFYIGKWTNTHVH